MNKTVLGIYGSPQAHWVGDGFPVRSLFSYDRLGTQISPFLMLDYAAPAHFPPATRARGVGEHPHRGFETVTIVYQGEVAHRDSAGNSGVIGPGDVQWMTAASGVLHDEFHSPAFMQRGGGLEMAQLWVNLPAAHKMSPPRYQGILSAQIPQVTLPAGAGSVRLIAGRHADRQGPADTFTELNVWDVRLHAGHEITLPLPEKHNAAIAVLRGAVAVNGSREAKDAELVLLATAGSEIRVRASSDSTLLVLSGTPIAEPIAGHGPFVMNTRAEIQTAMEDFQRGKFGRLPALQGGDEAAAGG
ncbi:MAG TPA: pirin family protein [Steroidobacteraceae bacterium]|nr:pirin family protein [Steroidobacteraceae bacterium]